MDYGSLSERIAEFKNMEKLGNVQKLPGVFYFSWQTQQVVCLKI